MSTTTAAASGAGPPDEPTPLHALPDKWDALAAKLMDIGRREKHAVSMAEGAQLANLAGTLRAALAAAPAAAPDTPTVRAALKQIIDADDAQTLCQQHIEYGRRALEQAPAAAQQWRHVRSGGVYTEMHRGQMQTSNELDMADAVVYRSDADGRVWIRPVHEFMDGRFERIGGAAGATGEQP